MLGVKSGVGTTLKNDYPSIVLWHCLNHRLELSVNDAIDGISGFNPIRIFFDKIYSLYSTSPKLLRQLHEISEELDITVKKIGWVFTIRWVASSYRTVKALWHNHQALYIHFKRSSEKPSLKKADQQQFKGFAGKLSTTSFVEDLTLLKDCLAQLATLSEAL